jgi:5-(carboxyamino)imidazole ribonucleotide synthase
MKIGILGAGQLAQMLALAGLPLGLRFVFLDPDAQAPAGLVGSLITASYDSAAALDQLAEQVELITYDFENVPVTSANHLAQRVPVHPIPEALAAGQDRLAEKRLFHQLGIPTAPFAAIHSAAELTRALAEIGLPAILKTRRFGYDGKGQFRLREPADVDLAWAHLRGRPLLLEGWVEFEREVSLLAARSAAGETAFYPLVHNVHHEGILHVSRAPYEDAVLQAQAEDYGQRLLDALDYRGVLAVEFFVHQGQLIANELAPRVHNSGHWTLEGASTSQFENHLRGILGLPLGSTAVNGFSAMVNCIGQEPALADVAAIPLAHMHSYGKQARAGRKLGHVTVVAPTSEQLEQQLAQLIPLVPVKLAKPGAR